MRFLFLPFRSQSFSNVIQATRRGGRQQTLVALFFLLQNLYLPDDDDARSVVSSKSR